VFPPGARWIIPPLYGILFSMAGLLFWWIATRLKKYAVITFLLLGGLWGVITHVLAIMRGILEKPPMLQGSGPAAALTIAAFEFIFYWCICLSIGNIILHFKSRSGK
jgi:vacuolar-type H+-ATPase subunit I/STV1